MVSADEADGLRASDGRVVGSQAREGGQHGRVGDEGVFGVEEGGGFGVDEVVCEEDGRVDGG